MKDLDHVILVIVAVGVVSMVEATEQELASNHGSCPDNQYWSLRASTCLSCTQCRWPSPVVAVKCGRYHDTICRAETSSDVNRRNPTRKIKEKVLNSSKNSREFLRELKLQQSADDDFSTSTSTSEVNGEVRYSVEETDPKPRGHDLHDDLMQIERELLYGSTESSTSGGSEPEQFSSGPEMTTALTTLAKMVMGKKRLFPSEQAIPSHNDMNQIEKTKYHDPTKEDHEYGAVKENQSSTENPDEDQGGVELSLLHRLLAQEQERSSEYVTLSILNVSLITVCVVVTIAGIIAVTAIVFIKCRHRDSFKLLDNGSLSCPRHSEGQTTTTDSRLNSPILSPGSTTPFQDGFYLSYVDESGRTQLKSRELPV